MKDFFYHVNGTEFHDTVAFGTAWKEAVKLAKIEHTFITRTVVSYNYKGEENIRYEAYLKGGCFLPDNMVTKEEYYIF